MNYLSHHTLLEVTCYPHAWLLVMLLLFLTWLRWCSHVSFTVKLLFPSFHTLWYLLTLICTSLCNQEFLWELPLCPLLMFQLVCLFLVLTDFKVLFIYKLQLSSPRESFSILTLFIMSFAIYVFNLNLIIIQMLSFILRMFWTTFEHPSMTHQSPSNLWFSWFDWCCPFASNVLSPSYCQASSYLSSMP